MNPATGEPAERSRDDFTTIRAFKTDAKMLAEIAELRGVTAAEAFRDVCQTALKRALVTATERRLSELKAGA